MKKFLSCLVLATLTTLPAHAEYVRKTVRPGFFIPTKELERVEKLPPFPERKVIENIEEEDINYEIEAQDGQASMKFADEATDELQRPDLNDLADKKIKVNLLQVHPMDVEETDVTKVLPSKQNLPHDDGLEKSKSYQKIHQQYQDDLKVIAETGKAPENEELKADLTKMNSNDSIWVDESFGKNQE